MADIAVDAGVLPDDSAAQGASKIFSYLWTSAWEHGAGTLDGDADALHDMRVHLRRLRTAMQNFEGPKSAPVLSRGLRAEIRDERSSMGALGDRLGAVRDYDVLTDYVNDYTKNKLKTPLEESPGLTKFVGYLEHARTDVFKTMTKRLKKAGSDGALHEEFGRWALGLPAAHCAAISVTTVAKVILPRRLEQVTEYADSLDAEGEAEDQHELRKSLRRVRYTLETLSVCFAQPVKPFVKQLVEMQDLLGEMQDRSVLAEATHSCFGHDLPEDVASFNEHGVRRRRYLLGRIRTQWQNAEKEGFWNELRAL